MSWWVYLIRCGDNSLYTGISTDPQRRLRQHQGLLRGGARSLRGRRPLELVYTEPAKDRSQASKRERAIKKMTHQEKEALAACGPFLQPDGGGVTVSG